MTLLTIGAVGVVWSPSREITIDDGRLAIELTVPGHLAIDEVSVNPEDAPDCPATRYEFGDDLVLEAFSTGCAVAAPQRVLNGRHGTYRTLADVPGAIDVQEVATGVGRAQVFLQDYEEHTNFSSEWREPVAIVTLDDPVDAEFPTLLLRSDKAALSLDDLIVVVTSLQPMR
ncbi:hypothetical protein LZ318_02975 [Saccharopolyspora indica]|uniref:hypothetical protein n=1 Tax=Saccharopolyspora indica TaxID=1229659 RepID=UPI0022EAAB76|nr:hypothetical protein [Saccharopolyspora indica]MDA3649439.1 hypothetical protein [Saccharopolyspora indica]